MPATNIKITATDKTKAAFTSVNSNVARMQKGVGMLKGVFVGLAGAMAARAFINFANQQLKMADTIGKMATKLNISTTALQTFRFAGEQSGESMQTMDNNLIKFAKNLGEAQTGIGLAKRELKLLGIELRNENGEFKSHEQILNEVADAYMGMENPARKMSSAMALFGRSGHVMVNMLSDGSKGLANLRKQLESTNGVIREDFIRDAEDANDAMNRLTHTFGTMATHLIADVAPAILDVTERMQELMGLDPVQTMSIRRVRDQFERVNQEIIKAKSHIKAATDESYDFSMVTEQTAVLEERRLTALLEERKVLAARLEVLEKVESRMENLRKLKDKINKTDETSNKLLGVTTQMQKFYTSELDAAFALETKRNEEYQKLIDAQDQAYSKELADKMKEHTDEIGYQNDKLAEQRKLVGEAFLNMRLMQDEYVKSQDKLNEVDEERIEKIRQYKSVFSEAILSMIADREKLSEKQLELQATEVDNATATTQSMIHSMKGFNKSWFDASKALSIAETIMNTYKAATAALAIPPPWVGMAYAATITGLGMANVARIKSQKYEGREFGGPVTGGRSYLVGERGPELLTMGAKSGNIMPNNQIGSTANITFNIQANDTRGFDELLLRRRGLIMSIINKGLNDHGRRALL